MPPNGTAWSSLSDRNTKENFEALDTTQILEGVARLPITAWTYKHDPEHRRYIGPVAQDFHAIFGLGDDTTISTLDADGVALAAIQGLCRRLKEKDEELAELRQQIQELKQELRAQRGGTL